MLALAAFLSAAQSTGSNVFANHAYYVDPNFQTNIDHAMKNQTGTTLANLKKMRGVGSAHWVSAKKDVSSVEPILDAAAAISPPPLVVFVVYNLPNRDCDAKNSKGEFCCTTKPDGTCDYLAPGNCSFGLAQYAKEFIDPIAAAIKKHSATVPIAIVLEPSSLPNLATNLKNPACANTATTSSYTLGLPYAVHAFAAAAPKAGLYIDAAHGAWLGWDDNAQAYATLLSTLKVSDKLRGLATNVANYQPLGKPCPASAFDDKMHNYCTNAGAGNDCCDDPCGLLAQYSR